jgi:hypothetical protein
MVLGAPLLCGQGDCGAVATFADGKAPKREIHVSPSGSDERGDGTAARPFATIARAARGATAGSAIRLHEGTYRGGAFLAGLAGTADAPIWIGGVSGNARPVLESDGDALHLSKPRHVVVHDLEVRNAKGNGINADDGGEMANPDAARNLVFRNLHVHDVGTGGNQDGLKLSGVRDCVVLDCAFARCGGGGAGSGIDMVGCHRVTVARSTFEQMSANAVQVKGGSDDVEIRACRMRDAGARAVNLGGSTGFEYFRPPLSAKGPNFEARNVRVIANVIIGSEAAVAFVGCVDCRVSDNTIVAPFRWVVRILQETRSSGDRVFLPSSGGRFVNNVVCFGTGMFRGFMNVGPDTDLESFRFENNLYVAGKRFAAPPSLCAWEAFATGSR